ncbi:MAG: leucine-rich repeat domain-containing protein, partial [Clostridia bacterium]|nr:leucine-rich repeat domain-containing protein [Clostridia bacterium]
TYKFDKEITLTATTNAGYTFLGWYEGEDLVCESEEFTFNVEKGATYTATWFTHTDTEYKVEYYLQNVEDDNYTLDHTDTLRGTTDTLATAEIKTFEHFTYNASQSTTSDNINGDGSRVLVVKYTRDKYLISAEMKNGSVSNDGYHKYQKEVTVTATPNLGYDFIGWYKGEELIYTDLTYMFTIEFDVVAKFELKEEGLSNFNFTSTTTSCTITGVKDKTVTEISVPDCVTNISSGAFSGCSNLQSITLPYVGGSKTATTASSSTLFGYIFGEYSYTGSNLAEQFYESGSYVTYYIPSSLTSVTITGGNIFYGAFYNLGSLTSVEIPDSVTTIGDYAFYNCSSLTSQEIWGSVTTIGDGAFASCDSLTSVVIGGSVTTIGEEAFYYCTSLTSVEMGTSVTTIGEEAFYSCSSLTSVKIPDSVTTIGEEAFYSCSRLKSVYYNGDVEGWCNITFSDNFSNPLYYAKNLYIGGELVTELVIPNSVTKIKDYVFYNCDSLTSVEIGGSVTTIGYCAFYFCDSLTSIEVSENNTVYKSIDGNLYSKDGTTLIQYAIGKTDAQFVIPDSVTTIGYGAFASCDSLTSVEIGGSVTEIAGLAFYECYSLTSVEIGGSVTEIGWSAFAYCRYLTSVVIPDSTTKIEAYAFYDCRYLTSVTFKDTSTWYYTSSTLNTGGTSINVTNPTKNVTYLRSTYCYYFWYKE